MRSIIGIDPGPEQSAYVRFDGRRVLDCGLYGNDTIRTFLSCASATPTASLAIEGIACYGMAVGKSVYDTCRWIGRFEEIWFRFRPAADIIYRPDIKLHLCNSRRAKDPNVRRVLLDRFGPPGTKKNPGPLFGVKSHIWSAMAVAVTWWDQHMEQR